MVRFYPPISPHTHVHTRTHSLMTFFLGSMVNCRLSVKTGNPMQNPNVRTSYCILTPSDFVKHGITVVIDSFPKSYRPYPSYRRHQHPSKDEEDAGVEDEAKLKEDGIKLVDMAMLNQSDIKIHHENFGCV